MKKLIFVLAITLLGSFSFVTIAEAKPKHKNYHYTQVKKKKHIKKPVRVARQQPVVQQPVYHAEDESAAAYFARENARQSQTVQSNTRSVQRTPVRTEQQTQYGGDLIRKASNYLGASAQQLGLPSRLWCADFMNMIVGGSDRRAISYAHRGRPTQYGCVNCVAVTKRRGGHHVGIVSGYDAKGNPIIISGNHGRRVGVGVYARHNVVAYRYV